MEVACSAIFAPQELALTVWAFATAGHRPGELWLGSFWAASRRAAAAAELSPQGVSLLLWAVGSLGVPPPRQWAGGLAASAMRTLHTFSPQSLANAAWGLATCAPREAPLGFAARVEAALSARTDAFDVPAVRLDGRMGALTPGPTLNAHLLLEELLSTGRHYA